MRATSAPIGAASVSGNWLGPDVVLFVAFLHGVPGAGDIGAVGIEVFGLALSQQPAADGAQVHDAEGHRRHTGIVASSIALTRPVEADRWGPGRVETDERARLMVSAGAWSQVPT
jgi:hypothetical protein